MRRISREPSKNKIYIFNSIPSWNDYFADIRENRDWIIKRLHCIVQERHLSTSLRHVPPIVAVHIRRGDFRELRKGEDFANVGGVRTSIDYFLTQIEEIRLVSGFCIPVMIFSDGTDDELRDVLKLPNVIRSSTSNDLVDLLLMSRARLIICSAGSTFGEWAGFLSHAIILRHPDHVNGRIRPIDFPIFEGPAPKSRDEWLNLWKNHAEKHLLPVCSQA